MSFQSSNGRCTIATYQATDEFTISVNNSEVKAELSSPDFEALLSLDMVLAREAQH